MMVCGFLSMGMDDRIARFTEIRRNLSLLPLFKKEEIEKFRVSDYGQQVLRNLRQQITSAQDNGKFIFTGHQGCGKSTLLGQFAQQMREQNLFVVGFSIADMVEMSDVNHVNILYSIALRLMEKASEKGISIPEGTKTR